MCPMQNGALALAYMSILKPQMGLGYWSWWIRENLSSTPSSGNTNLSFSARRQPLISMGIKWMLTHISRLFLWLTIVAQTSDELHSAAKHELRSYPPALFVCLYLRFYTARRSAQAILCWCHIRKHGVRTLLKVDKSARLGRLGTQSTESIVSWIHMHNTSSTSTLSM